jgi:hypothetical protein
MGSDDQLSISTHTFIAPFPMKWIHQCLGKQESASGQKCLVKAEYGERLQGQWVPEGRVGISEPLQVSKPMNIQDPNTIGMAFTYNQCISSHIL